MQALSFKSDIYYKCPHCEKSDYYVVYLNIDSIICNFCEKKQDVQLYASDVELKAI